MMPPRPQQQPQQLERRTLEIGRELFAEAARRRPRFGSAAWVDDQLMALSTRDEAAKVQMFRFVDALPALADDRAVARHLKEYLHDVRDRLPGGVGQVVPLLPEEGVGGALLARAARAGARRMARRFIVGQDVPETLATVERLRARSQAFTLDLLGEAVLSEAEAEAYQRQYLTFIDGVARRAATWPEVPLADRDHAGPIPRVNVSVKLSSLYSQFDPADPEGTSRAVRQRLRPILRLAKERGAFVNVDMEQRAYKNATLRIVTEVLSEDEFRDWADVGIAVQAYLRSCPDDLAALAAWAERRGTPLWVRLVKGAYWDFETIVAAQNGWPVPVWQRKPETDACFEAMTAFLIERRDVLRPAIASHNVRSVARALALAEAHGLPDRLLEFQALYGMADELKEALVARGQRVRVYAPFGQLLPGMAYLVRRLLENTSNESFLRAGFVEKVPLERLLMDPVEQLREASTPDVRASTSDVRRSAPDARRPPALPPFRNEPLTDFSQEAGRAAMAAALDDVRGRLGGRHPLVIAGQRVDTSASIDSVDPSRKDRLVGTCASAGADEARRAVEAADAAFLRWRHEPPAARAALLRRVADVLRRRRFELAAWEVFECGKPAREADADVAEAIDFCEFYAREMLRLAPPRRRDVPGELNAMEYLPRGVVSVIAPWNFPLAILCGMTAAAVVAGNAAVMKPAEQSSVVAAKLMEAFEEADAPPGVVNYLPGVGEAVGEVLVTHPAVAVIAFTGSRNVGLLINRLAAGVADRQGQIKRVIAELGGKNPVIVDEDADLDEAVHGVAASAFGYAGQKCSACSRAIVPDAIYDRFVERLVETARSLRVGPADDPGTVVGPVIDAEAHRRILDTIASASSRGLRLLYSADLGPLAGQGFYVPPTIFGDVPESDPLAQEEVFGPVLACIRCRDLTDAIRVANGTRYALTGGLYSRSPRNIDRVRRELRAGNLYVNRKITGALVDRQPFGGFALSGVGSKAGGPDYLQQFMLPRAVTENTLRHGFAPALEGPAPGE